MEAIEWFANSVYCPIFALSFAGVFFAMSIRVLIAIIRHEDWR